MLPSTGMLLFTLNPVSLHAVMVMPMSIGDDGNGVMVIVMVMMMIVTVFLDGAAIIMMGS